MIILDTGSHLLFGVTLAGLSMLDPAVSAHPEVLHAVFAAALLGSHAPDFDSVMRLRGESAYIRHHRGLTHSLPAPFVWAPVIGLPIAWLFGAASHSWIVVLWALIAVCFHIGLDLFNAYGVQCLRPFSRKWWHLDVLCLFDPYLFTIHAAAALIWLFRGGPAGPMFACVYGVTILYVAWRTWESKRTVKKLKRTYGEQGYISLIPSLFGGSWQYVAESEDSYITGRMKRGMVTQEAVLMKTAPSSYSSVARATMGTDGVRAFLHFAQSVHVHVNERLDGYEVTWSDVRFWHNHKMPFSAAVTLDRDLNVLSDQLGWKKKSWEPPHV
ncbi:metal-dependent hydrolase [Paenibacillus solisilvae]|uniref:Metal-dependent hydrolase n=1 Tax=Paenibacillus solisilvae TaxID=2486751 RepID=A0ABW0VV44_9BACL